MKKLFTILFLLAMTFSVSAQFSDVDQIKSGFQTFADETANALPLAASMGLNWNDAYSGEFPHFGVGLTLGAVFLPTEAFEEILTAAGESIPSELSSLGIPLPVYTVDARLGLPKLPMDVGFKVGYLDPEWLPAGEFKAGYTMIGGDVRWAFFKDKGIIPDLSVGFGYTYLSGTVSYPVPDQSFPTDAGTVALVDSDMSYNWNSSVFDLKAQVSKKLLILNLSAGAGYSFGISKAGGRSLRCNSHTGWQPHRRCRYPGSGGCNRFYLRQRRFFSTQQRQRRFLPRFRRCGPEYLYPENRLRRCIRPAKQYSWCHYQRQNPVLIKAGLPAAGVPPHGALDYNCT